MLRKLIFPLLLTVILFGNNLSAQDSISVSRIKTGVYVNPPFVMKDSTGLYYGMAIDLWEMLGRNMNFVAEYTEYYNWSDMINATLTEEVDMAVSSISVTYDRAKLLKFSFPWFDSGLRIMVQDSGKGSMWNELKKNGHLQTYGWIILIIITLTLILTIIHRKRDKQFPRNWLDGITESLYRLVLAIKTGVVNNKNYNWIGKILAVTWMIVGVGLVAYITSSITSTMTAIALKNDINSLSDLPGKRVGVLAGTVAEEYINNRSIQTIGYKNIDTAIQALIANDIDAIVEDTPVLEYWVFKNPEQKLRVVGNIFHPDKYAFAANKKYSTFMDNLSVEIIRLFDNEKIKILKDSYFGNVH